MIQAVIFDLDGTLIDSSKGIGLCLELSFSEFKLTIDPILTSMIGPPIREIISDILRLQGKFSDELVSKIEQVFRRIYDAQQFPSDIVYPGIPGVIKKLKEQGICIAVATNKPSKPTAKILSSIFHGEIVDFLSPDSIAGRLLDKPKMIAEILQRKTWDKDRVVIVGDAPADIRSAKVNGCRAIAAAYGYGNREALLREAPSAIAERPEQVLELIIERTQLEERI